VSGNADRYDPEAVRQLFDEMSATYGRINVITSFGFAVRWRHQVVEGLPLSSAGCVVDLMSGMGELWRSLARSLDGSARVIGIDFSEGMAGRARRDWPFTLEMRMADALAPPESPGVADVVVSSFGLKTFNRDQQRVLAQRTAALLKPGGSFAFIEISVPPNPVLRFAYMFYLKRIIPLLGKLLLGNPGNYRMLGIYTEAFGNTAYFAGCLRAAGLQVAETSHFFGCATGARGSKPK
jgi:ubiquinone/menaquinone biosynthesis C-methylase UbiE